jgi:hypothetical protein
MRTRIVGATASLLLLAGCSAGTGTDFGLPDETPDAPCIVGTWQLDVADYSAQSEAWLQSQNPDYIDFEMTGTAQVTFTETAINSVVDLSSSVILLAGEQPMLEEARNAYSGSGDWAQGDEPDTIEFSYWATAPDAGADIPTVDFFAVPSLTYSCSATELALTSTGAPLTAHWHR